MPYFLKFLREPLSFPETSPARGPARRPRDGPGHLYLGQWKRTAGWVAVLFGTGYLLVDPTAPEAMAGGGAFDVTAIWPVLLVGSLGVLDAYVVARAGKAVTPGTAVPDGRQSHCPNCGRELDEDLEFSHRCTEAVPDPKSADPNDVRE